jgi:hypothetical protein
MSAKYLSGNLKERDHLQDIDKITLILKEQGAEWINLAQNTVGGGPI